MAADKANSGVSSRGEAQRKDIGADWEDAFQAEDYLISPDSTSETLFGQKTSPTSDQRTIREKPSSMSPLAAATVDQTVVGRPAGRRKRKGKIGSILHRLLEAMGQRPFLEAFGRQGVGRWFGALSPVARGAMFTCFVSSLLVLLCWLFFWWAGDEAAKKQPSRVALHKVLGEKTTATGQNVDGIDSSVSESGEVIGSLFSAQQTPELFENGADQRKWRFSSFLIDAGSNEEGKINYVVLDLSLVLRLEPGVDLPFDKEYAIRNMVYQFFNNRPIYELRRFSLARREMKQKIRAWFNKEWPDNSIESVLFHRYLII